MRWYFPAWNGDHRLIAAKSNDGECVLEISDPTAGETEKLEKFLALAVKEKWTDVAAVATKKSGLRRRGKQKIVLAASIAAVGEKLVAVLKDKVKDRTITAVTYEDGEIRVGEKEAPTEKAKVAATVTRPTPCCPQCEVGAVDRASECLLEFLNEEEHASWMEHRRIVVEGGITGHRYVLAHRRSPTAARIGRMCFDLDDGAVVHFHDNSVPPEEEVLAAKLILQHREPWLRNEATMFTGGTNVFKNPFGGLMDGTESAALARGFGMMGPALDALRDR